VFRTELIAIRARRLHGRLQRALLALEDSFALNWPQTSPAPDGTLKADLEKTAKAVRAVSEASRRCPPCPGCVRCARQQDVQGRLKDLLAHRPDWAASGPTAQPGALAEAEPSRAAQGLLGRLAGIGSPAVGNEPTPAMGAKKTEGGPASDASPPVDFVAEVRRC
jgi:hypothetical protein